MKRILLIILTLSLTVLSGCSQNKKYTIFDITAIKEEYPESITVTFYDEYQGTCVITDTEVIVQIIDLLKAREYSYLKSYPSPGSQRQLLLTYSSGETVGFSTRIIAKVSRFYFPTERDSLDSIVQEYGIQSGDITPR